MKTLSTRRLHTGSYEVIFVPDLPSQEEIEKAIADAKKNLKSKKFVACCACCTNGTAVPSDVVSISKIGMCCWCLLFKEGKVKYVRKWVSPTLEQAEQHFKNGDAKEADARVIFKEYERLKCKKC